MADDLRATAYLAVEGDATVTWRACFSTNGSDAPTGIAPVCIDEDHEEADGSVYDCCREPVIETGSAGMAAYLVDLLNVDICRQAPPFFFQPGRTYTRGSGRWTFHCLAVAPVPWMDEIRAVGYLTRNDGTGSATSLDPDDWEQGGWAEYAEGEAARD